MTETPPPPHPPGTFGAKLDEFMAPLDVADEMPLGLYAPDVEPFWFDEDIVLYNRDFRDVAASVQPVDIVFLDPPHETKSSPYPVGLVALALSKATAAAWIMCDWDEIVHCPPASDCYAAVCMRSGCVWNPCLFYMRPAWRKAAPLPKTITYDEACRSNGSVRPSPWCRGRMIESCHGNTILDAFCGTGETLVAARLAGRRAIGFEPDAEKCRIAANAIAQQVIKPKV